MARRRDFVRGAAAISNRRQTTWFQYSPAIATMTAPGGTLFFSLNAAALALRPFTVVRSHFHIGLRSDQAAAIEEQIAGVGLAVVSDEAVAVGVTAVPTPITEMGSDLWFVHQLIYASESRVVDKTREGQYISIDSKAMRKVGVGQDIVLVVEMSAASTGGMVITVGGRQLIKNN